MVCIFGRQRFSSYFRSFVASHETIKLYFIQAKTFGVKLPAVSTPASPFLPFGKIILFLFFAKPACALWLFAAFNLRLNGVNLCIHIA